MKNGTVTKARYSEYWEKIEKVGNGVNMPCTAKMVMNE